MFAVIMMIKWGDEMKTFKAGKIYQVNGGGLVTVEKRTRCYITIAIAAPFVLPFTK